MLFVLVIEAVTQYGEVFRSRQSVGTKLAELFGRHFAFVVVVLVAMIPTFISRWIVYGGAFETGYSEKRHFLWDAPVFGSVLFSANHGLLSWTPLVGLALIGLFLFAVRVPRIGIPFVAGAVAFYVLISFYSDWAGISSYGNRFFISLTAMMILGLGYVLERFAGRFRQERTAVAVSSAGLACFVLWNLGLIYQWGMHLVPARGPISFREAAHNQFFVVPGQMSSQIRSYLFRRSALMQQIEERDIEQQKSERQKDSQP
jgi:hypothetical protein